MRKPIAVVVLALMVLVPACTDDEPVEQVRANSMFGEPPGGLTYQEVPGEELADIADQIEDAPGVVDFAARLLVDGDGVVQAIVQAIGQDPALASDPDHFEGFMTRLQEQAGASARPENVEGVDVRVIDPDTGPSLAIWQVPGTNVFLMVNAADEQTALRVATALIQ
jgi:hypothetical protein